MKQGINFELPLNVPVNVNDVTQIEFLFVQGEVEKSFIYPSDVATKINSHAINLLWTADDTWLFKPNVKIDMDTFIIMKGTMLNPETAITSFTLSPTLFKRK